MSSELIDFVENLSRKKRGIFLGFKNGKPKFASFEDCASVLGGTRTGKSTGFLIQSIALHPGPVIVTSTRDDLRDATLISRNEVADHFGGEVVELIFNGRKSTNPNVRSVYWDLIGECKTWEDAEDIASVIVNTAITSSKERHWADRAKQLLAPILYIAKFNGLNMEEVNKLFATDKCECFHEDAKSIAEYCESNTESELLLDSGQVASADPFYSFNQIFGEGFAASEELSSIFSTLSGVLSKVKNPPEGVESISIKKIIEGHSTVYIKCKPSQAKGMSPFISAFITTLTESWKAETSHLYRSALDRDKTMLLALDETTNIARIPTLPSMILTSGGDGIQIITCLQSAESAKEIWGDESSIVVEGTNHQIFTKRFGSRTDMSDLSAKLGEHDHDMVSVRIKDGFVFKLGFAEEEDLLFERKMLYKAYESDLSQKKRYQTRVKILDAIIERRRKLNLGYRYQPSPSQNEPYEFLVREIMENTEVVLTTVKAPNVPVSLLWSPPPGKTLVISDAKCHVLDVGASYDHELWKRLIKPFGSQTEEAQVEVEEPEVVSSEIVTAAYDGNPLIDRLIGETYPVL